MAPNGYLALVLHAHLPYVRHPEYDEFLEEDWLFEAITETYLPLLDVLYRMADEGVPFQITMSLTPPLCHMLRDPLLQERTSNISTRSLELARSETERTHGEPRLEKITSFYRERLEHLRWSWEERWKRDLVSAFAALMERGFLEIITCAATHGFLPLMENYPEAVRAQIFVARDHYRETFGRDAAGHLAARMRLCARPGSRAAGGEPALVYRRFAWAHVWQSAPALRDLRALLYAGRTRGLRAGSRFEPPGLEQRGGLSG